MTSILLVEDHTIVRDALKFYFDGDPEYQVKGEASNGREALELMKKGAFNIILTDINMPLMSGVELLAEIRKDYPDQKVLVLSMFDDLGHIKKMLSLGANGYVLKDTRKDELTFAIQTIIEGETYFAREVYQKVIDSMSGMKSRQRLTFETELTSREKEVLQLVLKELSNQEIADQLFISVRTVEGHKRSLLSKTGCKNTVGLVMYALEHQLIKEYA